MLNVGLKDKNIDTNISLNSNVPKEVIAQKEIVYEYEEIANYSSTLLDGEKNRVFNIQKACDTLNGVVIKQGQEFSFNNTIGPMGEENGYLKATGFDSNGKNIQISAGGMCQVSSTLYNVLLISGVEIIPKGIASKSPRLLVMVRPGYFLPLNQTRRGPTLSQSILSIIPPCCSILSLSSFTHGVCGIFNSFIFLSSVIKILLVFPKFIEIILFILFIK